MKPELEDILSALADEHSIKILMQAATGLKGDSSTHKNIGLSKKQYYTRLNRLVRLGLISRNNGLYRYTALGAIVINTQLKPLEEALNSYWSLLAIDELKRSKVIPQQEQDKIAEIILNKNFINARGLDGGSRKATVFSTHDDAVRESLKLINSAKSEIFVVSRCFEPEVSKLLLGKFRTGVALNILDGNPSGASFTAQLRDLLDNPESKSLTVALLKSTKVRIKRRALEYSFIVVDGEHCGIEIANPLNTQEFNLAIGLSDKEQSQKMIALFEELCKSAEADIKVEISNEKRL
ncbi:MAG: hypothetical protein M1503_00180 [Thaumarchaeota archaeon]|nr:hypothetical protein [Nitrososphaerota archaeon]MCL5316668.1 hypothetical protein [Nitrososphaerota archaeon]